MYKVSDQALKKAHKPFDIVQFPDGELAYINEVNVNNCQESPEHQISYSINFITENPNGHKNAWYCYETLAFKVIGNMLVLMAEAACHNALYSGDWVEKVLINK